MYPQLRRFRLSFKFRLFLSSSVLFLLIALFVSFLFSMTAQKNAKENEIHNSEILLERVSSQIEALYDQMDVAATAVTKNTALKSIVLDLNALDSSRTEETPYGIETARPVQNTLVNLMFSSAFSNVLLYNREHGYFYYTGLYLGDTDLITRQLEKDGSYDYLRSTGADRLLLGPHLSPWSSGERTVISVIRNFSDYKTTQSTIAEVQVPYERLEEICGQETFEGEKQIVILNGDYEQVYPFEAPPSLISGDKMDAVIRQVREGKERSFTNAFSYYGTTVCDGAFHVILLSANQSLMEYRRANLINTVTAVCLVLAASCLILFAIISLVSKPLKQLIDHINTMSLDQDAPLKLDSGTLDEFELINQSFNQMLVKLKDSINQVYESRLRESNANLAALQAQINPHFLYNALNSISAAGEIYGSRVTTSMCQQFSSMMRYITSGSQQASLLDEIRHTRNYLDFMKISYDGSFDYTLDIPLELNHIQLPKLVIEPLAENCFKHGFRECVPPLFICIEGALENGCWSICIRDNGSGISKETIAEFESFKKSYCQGRETPLYGELCIDGLGLKNIYGRLFLFFHENVNLTIGNQPEGGGMVIIKGVLHD